MTELDVLDAIEQAKGKNAKVALLKNNVGNPRLKELLNATFNMRRKYYIKKFNDTFIAIEIPFINLHEEFMALLSRLEGGLRGHAAQADVITFLCKCNGQQRKWYARVIRRDLKSGFSVSSANKAGFDIPAFQVQLAKDGKQCKKMSEMFKKGMSGSKKFDGYRCFAEIVDGEVTLLSRGGEIYLNFETVEKALAEVFPIGKYCFDGEIMSDDFNAMQKSAFASKRRTIVGDMVFHIFDHIPYDEWENKTFKMKALDRYQYLEDIRENLEAKQCLTVVDRISVNDLASAEELERQFISEGFEGLMLNPNIPYYVGKKSNKMVKFKTMLSMDCEVLDKYPGDTGTKYENTLGGVVVLQENGKQCNVGSGFSDEERDELWNNFDKYKGRVIEVKYQELTNKDKMRFGIKKRWRTDKD